MTTIFGPLKNVSVGQKVEVNIHYDHYQEIIQ